MLSSPLLPGSGPAAVLKHRGRVPAVRGHTRVLDHDRPLPPAKGRCRPGDSAGDTGPPVSTATRGFLMVSREPRISLCHPEASRVDAGDQLWGQQKRPPPARVPVPAADRPCGADGGRFFHRLALQAAAPERAQEAGIPPARKVSALEGTASSRAVRNQWQEEKKGKFLLNASNLLGCVVQ